MKSMKSLLGAAVLSLSVTILAACTTAEIRGTADDRFDNTFGTAQDMLAARHAARIPVVGPIVSDMPYVDVTPITRVQREPMAFARVVNFNADGLSLHALSQRIEGMTGVKVRYQQELITGQPGLTPARIAPPMINGITLPGMPAGPQLIPAAGPGELNLSYSGSLKGLFEEISEQTGAHWRWDATRQVVDFFAFETETFRVATVPGTGETSFELGGQATSSGGQNTLELAKTGATHSTPTSVWSDIGDTVGKLVGAEGAYQINETAGLVVVRDRPDRMETIRSYFDTINATLSRQVDIEVTLYRVSVRDRDFKGVSWDLLFQQLIETSGYNLAWSSVRPDVVSEGASSAVIRVPETDVNGIPHRYANSQLFLDALTTIGRTSIERSTSVITTNNRAAPAKFVRRVSYLAETVPTFATGGGEAISTGAGLKADFVETGLNLYLLPHVQDDGKRLQLKAMVSNSNLDALNRESSGNQSIQLPDVSEDSFAAEMWLNSGETMVLTSNTQSGSGNTSKSPFGRWWAIGGERSINHDQELLVITMTPVVSASRSRI